MIILLDTSVLVRLADITDQLHPVAGNAVDSLEVDEHEMFICPQVLVEFTSVATRPMLSNGLGMTSSEATLKRRGFQLRFPTLVENHSVFAEWQKFIVAHDIIGKTVHDARLVTISKLEGVSAILTFNLSHFSTLCQHVPGLRVLDPVVV